MLFLFLVLSLFFAYLLMPFPQKGNHICGFDYHPLLTSETQSSSISATIQNHFYEPSVMLYETKPNLISYFVQDLLSEAARLTIVSFSGHASEVMSSPATSTLPYRKALFGVLGVVL